MKVRSSALRFAQSAIDAAPAPVGSALATSRDRASIALLHRTQPYLAEVLAASGPHSLLSQRKRVNLYMEAHRTLERGVPGAFIEIGTHKGGGALVIAAVAALGGRAVHLFDRWGDLPRPTPEDGETGAAFEADHIVGARLDLREDDHLEARVAALIQSTTAISAEELFLHKGWYEDTLPGIPKDLTVAFAHLDADWYESMRLALRFIDEHLSPGGSVLMDDWGDWPGVRTAFEEYESSTARRVQLYPGRGQAVFTLDAP